jgi:hypothetical protein
MVEDLRPAIAVIAILVVVKIVVGALILFFLPVGPSVSLYAIVHLGALFGLVPLLFLLSGSIVFWWKVLRLRARRRRLQWLEWHVDDEPGVRSDASPDSR